MRRYSGITRALLYDSAGNYVAFDKLSPDTLINDQPQEPETTNGTIHGQNAVDWQLHFFDFTTAKVNQLTTWMLNGTDVRAMMIGESTAYNFFKVTEPIAVYLEPTNARDGVRRGFVAGSFIGANYQDFYVTQDIARTFGRDFDIWSQASYVFFASAELVAQTIYPSDRRPTVDRASVKNVVNQQAVLAEVAVNKLAVEFNADRTLKGALIEPAATNLYTYSQQFDNADWTKVGATIVSNAIVAPNGTTTADKLVEENSNAVHRVEQLKTLTATPYSISYYLKQGERIWAGIRGVNSLAENCRAWFNLSTGVVGSTEGTGASSTIEDAGDGWYRCTLTIASASASAFEYQAFIATGDGVTIYVGDGTSGIYVWQADLIASPVATSPIYTEGGTVTRLADDVFVDDASSLIGQTEGTLYMEPYLDALYDGGGLGPAGIEVGDGGNFANIATLGIGRDSPNNRVLFINRVSSSTTVFVTADILSTGFFKTAAGYSGAGNSFYKDGVKATAYTTGTNSTPVTVTSFDTATIGGAYNGVGVNSQTNNHIRVAALFKTRLSDTLLARLTS